ncbi:copper resistance CopC family protein [Streptomyces sp. NPDC004262]
MRRLRLLTAPVVAVAACALLAGGGGPAYAHTALDTASPAPGAKVGSGTKVISLTFGQLLRGTVPKVSAAGPNGAAVPVGEPVVVPGSTVCAAVDGLPVGVDTITYTVIAVDGDAQTNTFEFQVVPGAPAAGVPSGCRGRVLPAPPARRPERASGFLDGRWATATAVSAAAGAVLVVTLSLAAVRRRRRRSAVAEKGGDPAPQ